MYENTNAKELAAQTNLQQNSKEQIEKCSEINPDTQHKTCTCWNAFLPPMTSSEKRLFIISLIIFVSVTIAISVLFSTWEETSIDTNSIVTSGAYILNKCTEEFHSISMLLFLANQDMFDYRQYNFMYQASVISTQMTVLFGFEHELDFWGLDDIVVTDTFTNSEIPMNTDGSFELNNITQSYRQCSLSSDQVFLAQILGDFPHLGDSYYSDGSRNGMVYLMQSFPITGGRNYNVSFWLQNNGSPPNRAIVLINS